MFSLRRMRWCSVKRKKATAITILLLTLALLCSMPTQEDLKSSQTNLQSSQTTLQSSQTKTQSSQTTLQPFQTKTQFFQTNLQPFQTKTQSFQTTVLNQPHNQTIPDSSPGPYTGIARGDVSWLQTPEDFFRRLEREEEQTHCFKMARMGGKSCRLNVDGQKYVCLDPDLLMRPRHCVVYSFGVSTEISFDMKVNEFGCHDYLLDPTLPPGAYDWLTGNMKFFPYGLAHKNKTIPMNITTYSDWDGVTNATVLPFDEVRKVIGHNGPVHYLKMDVEGAEWISLRHMMDHGLLQDVFQIGIEIHLSEVLNISAEMAVQFLRKRWLFLEELEDHGFLRARYDPTNSIEAEYTIPGTNGTVQTCGELLLLRRAGVATRLLHQLR